MSTILIFYHHPCSDGKAAAWVAKQHFAKENKQVHFFGVEPSNVEGTLFTPLQNFIDSYNNVMVYCLDISLGYDSYQKLESNPEIEKFLIIDHHKTGYDSMIAHFNENNLPSNYIFDFNESGCSLSWHYFNPGSQSMPKTLEYIKDRDLWTFKLPNSKAITQGIYIMLPIGDVNNFLEWDNWMLKDEFNISNALIIGNALLNNTNNLVKSKAHDGDIIDVNGINIFLINTTDLISDFGNYICNEKTKDDSWLCDIAIMWRYSHANKLYYLSFRGNPNREVDVSQFAKSLNPTGGGHRSAAGCTLTKLPEWML
jgi:oligoribonuclease NrnB/cAMP/cGMP phosphodiesterase (DHH superfamily)